MSAGSPPQKLCAAPGCTTPVERRHRRGRPPIYCSPSCRGTAHAKQPRPTIVVEVDHEPTADNLRPTGRVWLVRLRRGAKSITVATDLGRPSADHLAGEITAVITGQPGARGGAVE